MILRDLDKNKERLIKIFNNTSDLILYEFETLCNKRAMVVYLDVMVDKNGLYECLIKPLIKDLVYPDDVMGTVPIAGAKKVYNIEEVVDCILVGKTVLFMDKIDLSYVFDLGFWKRRGVEEPINERVIRGPREGFVEDINVNKSLMRNRIRNVNLVFESYNVGTVTNTEISLVYLQDIVNPNILKELKRRLDKINLSVILNSASVQHEITDSKRSIVPTVGYTERPDVLAAKITEGRIGIICDGSPMVLTLPFLFIEELQNIEDYMFKPKYGSYIRIIRLIALSIATLLPAFVVALQTYHHEMIPTRLITSISQGREGVPFTAMVEALLMILFFEFMKESSIRIPGNIGPAVTTISGLVLGQTAVQAGLVGPFMVITIAIMGITEFILPNEKETIVLYRYIFLVLGGVLGLFGIIVALILVIVHLISIESFGVPFMYPITPYDKEAMKDFLHMRPMREMNYRPRYMSKKESRKRN